MTMTATEIRAAAPTGRDRTFEFQCSLTGTSSVRATVIEHGHAEVYVGMHPFMLCIPYADITSIQR